MRYICWHGCLAADVLALELFGNDEVKKTNRLAHHSVVDQNATVQGVRGMGPLRSAVRQMMHWRDPVEVLKIVVFLGAQALIFSSFLRRHSAILLLGSSHNVSFPFLPLSDAAQHSSICFFLHRSQGACRFSIFGDERNERK